MYELADNHDWIKKGANLLLFGASGVGKTHLASSLGYSLIEAGIRVKFYAASALVQQLQEAKQLLKLQDALNTSVVRAGRAEHRSVLVNLLLVGAQGRVVPQELHDHGRVLVRLFADVVQMHL